MFKVVFKDLQNLQKLIPLENSKSNIIFKEMGASGSFISEII